MTGIGSWLVSTSATDRDPNGFEFRQVTSHATPLVVSVVALVKEVRGSLDPATVQSLLVSRSHPQLYHDGEKFLPNLAPVAQQGGGLVRAYDSAYATTLVELKSAGLNFNDTEHFVPSLEFSLNNTGEDDIRYRLSHVPALTVYTFAADGTPASHLGSLPFEAAASLTISDNTPTVASKRSATVRITAAPPQGLEDQRIALRSGWIAVNGSDGSSLSIPYQGVLGSIREHRVLQPDGASLSYQDVSVSGKPTIRLPSQGSAEESQLVLHVKETLGSPLVRADVVPSASGGDAADSAKAIGQMHGFPV